MSEIRNKILQSLEDVELTRQVRIPIAIESGSRAWGFASPDSDYDCRFIYIKQPDAYLSVFEAKDTIDFTPDAIYDINGWDLRKVISHLVKSNAVMLEWLSSGVIYRMNQQVHRELWQLGKLFFNPVSVSWHYLSSAKNKLAEITAGEESSLKKTCYVLRPLAAIRYIQAFHRAPHMEYRKNLDAITLAPELRNEIHLLLEQKEKALESGRIQTNARLLEYFHSEVAEIEASLSGAKHEKCKEYHTADEVFRRVIRMVWP